MQSLFKQPFLQKIGFTASVSLIAAQLKIWGRPRAKPFWFHFNTPQKFFIRQNSLFSFTLSLQINNRVGNIQSAEGLEIGLLSKNMPLNQPLAEKKEKHCKQKIALSEWIIP